MASTQAHDNVHESTTAKRDLKSWWKNFTNREKKEEEKAATTTAAPAYSGIFGVPLQLSVTYANVSVSFLKVMQVDKQLTPSPQVAISLLDAVGKSFTYGYVPIVVAKCGVFLKEKATEVEGIFRLPGAERRIRELQATFNSPDKYGKGLDWTGYTVHDAANVLRRYFNQLPEPIVPLDFYERFRDPIRGHQEQAVGNTGGQQLPVEGEFDAQAAIKTYQQLITEIPPLNRQLLLYVLDLLAVFASKSDVNQMTAPNLAIIFQPGLLSSPQHMMNPVDYRLSQDVLIFLIDNQDHFLVGMQGTAADEKTIQEVQGAAARRSAGSSGSTPSRQKSLIGRSASNASAGADSLRKFGSIRRNVSTSSKRSRHSNNNTPSPVTPPPESPYNRSSGVYRSNTVPSKKSQSPSVGTTGSRFNLEREKSQLEREKSQRSQGITGVAVTGVAVTGVQQQPSTPAAVAARAAAEKLAQPKTESVPRARPTPPKEREPEQPQPRLSPHLRPVKDKRAPSTDRQLKMDLPASVFGPNPSPQGRKPNKLQKRRPEDGHELSAKKSPTNSIRSRSHSQSVTGDELSSHEGTDAEHYDMQPQKPKKEKRHSRWRLSTVGRNKDNKTSTSPKLGATTSSLGTGDA